jgi:hypothetical protein
MWNWPRGKEGEMERGTERGGTLEAVTGRNGVERLIVMAGLERLMEAHPNKLFLTLVTS